MNLSWLDKLLIKIALLKAVARGHGVSEGYALNAMDAISAVNSSAGTSRSSDPGVWQ